MLLGDEGGRRLLATFLWLLLDNLEVADLKSDTVSCLTVLVGVAVGFEPAVELDVRTLGEGLKVGSLCLPYLRSEVGGVGDGLLTVLLDSGDAKVETANCAVGELAYFRLANKATDLN